MKIAVCIKRVPDTATKIRIADDGMAIDSADVQYIMSPYDEFAVEEAIRIKEHAENTTVTVVCLGPEAAQQNLRQALAMGADSGILLKTDALQLDSYQVAQALASALRDEGYDLILFGRQAVDDQNGLVGPMTARLLGLPCVTDVVGLTVGEAQLTVEREIEGARERIEVTLPAALTAQKGLNEPRYASLKGIMAAKKKPIEEGNPTTPEARTRILTLALPPPRPAGQIVGEGVDAVPELVRRLREEAKVI